MSDLDRPSVLASIAAAAGTGVDDIALEESLLDLGIDSVRLMRLVDTWRSHGAHVSFADLAATETVQDALDLVRSA